MGRAVLWFSLEVVFGGGIWIWSGREHALQFATGYLIELSLSMDNVLVVGLIFSYFAIPLRYQHRVVSFGILGALVLRA